MRILIIRDNANGDVLLTTPLVRFLRRQNPEATIIYVTSANCIDVIKNNPDINRIFTIETLRRKAIQEIDVVYDLRDFVAAIPGNVHAKRVIRASDHPLLHSDLVSRKARAKNGKSFARLYCDLADVPETESLENVFVLKGGKLSTIPEKYIAVSLDSCWQTKLIPFHLAQQIVTGIEKILPVVLVGRSGDYRKIKATQNLVLKTSIAELAYVINRSALFVGIDSFPLHLADTLKKPSVSIWSSTGPPNTILTDGALDFPIEYKGKCRHCYLENCHNKKCFPSAEAVINAVHTKMGALRDPKTWIIIPTYNQGHLTYDLLESMSKTEGLRTVILVNDGSDRTTSCLLDMLAEKHRAEVIHKPNGGFVSACNAGIEYALKNGNDKDTLILLNNDVVVNHGGWLNALVTGCNNKYVVGQQGSRLKEDFTHGGYTNSNQDCDYIDGWCLFAPLRYFKDNSVGLLDSNIKTFSEDADWCIRVKRLGIEMRVIPNIGLKHLHHQTFNSMGQKDAHIPSLHYMREKWGTLSKALNNK